MNYFFQILTLISIGLSFIGCQKNSTLYETPIVIEDQTFALAEHTPSGTVVGQVQVKNSSANGLNFYLVSGDYSNAFRMETSSGRLILKDSSLINYEAIKQINLEVMVGYEDSIRNYGVLANLIIRVENHLETYTWNSKTVLGKNQNALVSSFRPESNLVQSAYLFASAWTVNLQVDTERSFLQFDLSSIPVDVQIAGATLSLFNPKDGDTNHKQSFFWGSNAFYIRRVISMWNDQTITWNNQPAFSLEGQAVLPTSQIDQQDYEQIDVSEMVQYMVRYPEENYGFILILNDENRYRRVCFAALDHPDENLRPKLEITYLK